MPCYANITLNDVMVECLFDVAQLKHARALHKTVTESFYFISVKLIRGGVRENKPGLVTAQVRLRSHYIHNVLFVLEVRTHSRMRDL